MTNNITECPPHGAECNAEVDEHGQRFYRTDGTLEDEAERIRADGQRALENGHSTEFVACMRDLAALQGDATIRLTDSSDPNYIPLLLTVTVKDDA